MPCVKISDATESQGRYIDKTNQYIKFSGIDKSVIVKDGDLILSNSGTAGLPKFMRITACIHDGWQVFTEYNGIDKLFLYYLLLSYRSRLLHGAYYSTIKNLTLDMLRALEIDLPPLDEQERIAGILGALDDKIECNNRINRNLEEQTAALFRRWFVDFEFPNPDPTSPTHGKPYRSFGGEMTDSPLGKTPSGWKLGTLEDITYITMGQSPSGESYTPLKKQCCDLLSKLYI